MHTHTHVHTYVCSPNSQVLLPMLSDLYFLPIKMLSSLVKDIERCVRQCLAVRRYSLIKRKQ